MTNKQPKQKNIKVIPYNNMYCGISTLAIDYEPKTNEVNEILDRHLRIRNIISDDLEIGESKLYRPKKDVPNIRSYNMFIAGEKYTIDIDYNQLIWSK